jgi:hypothetical protein
VTDRGTGGDHVQEPVGLDAAARLQRDLYLFWREAADPQSDVPTSREGLALTTRGYLSRAALRRVRERLAAAQAGSTHPAADADATEPEDGRTFFVRRLLERLGLLRRAEGEAGVRLIAAERALLERYLAHPLAERVRIGVRLWVAGGWWPESVDPGAAPPRTMMPAAPTIAVARRRLLEDLLALEVGAAIGVPPASGAAFSSPPRPRAPRARRHLAANATGEAAVRRAALLGPLAWFGVVAPARDGRTVRVAAGIAALRPEPGELPEHHGRVALLPDFTIIAYPPLTAPEMLLLDSCAREESLDAVARYRLTAAEYARAHRLGWRAEDVAARLESLVGTALPQNVRTTLDDWERNAERLRLTSGATLLTVPEAKLLDALLADPATAAWVVRRISPLHALLASDAAPAVRAWLLRKGVLPAMSGAG